MLIESKIDKSQWIWINIPKTASTFIRNCLYGNKNILDGQTHLTYLENVHLYGQQNAFTVVRDPLTRFKSGLNHIFSECNCGKCTIFYDRPPTTIEVVSFLNDLVKLNNKHKNFHYSSYQTGSSKLWLEILKSMQINFIKSRIIMNPVNCVMWAFILPQFLYLDKIQSRDYIFKYETLNDCAEFIRNRLGYTVDTSVKHRQYSYKLSNVDFTDKELLDLLKNYYKEDYTELNY